MKILDGLGIRQKADGLTRLEGSCCEEALANSSPVGLREEVSASAPTPLFSPLFLRHRSIHHPIVTVRSYNNPPIRVISRITVI